MMRGGRRRDDRPRPTRRQYIQHHRWYQHPNWRPQWPNWNPQYWQGQGPPHPAFSWRPPYQLPHQYYWDPPAPWHQQYRHWREERPWQHHGDMARYEPQSRSDSYVESSSQDEFSSNEQCCSDRSPFRCIPLVQGAVHEHPRHVDNYDYPHLSVSEDNRVQGIDSRTSRIVDSQEANVPEQVPFSNDQKLMYNKIDKITPFVSNKEITNNPMCKTKNKAPVQEPVNGITRNEVSILKENVAVKQYNPIPSLIGLELNTSSYENGQNEEMFVGESLQFFHPPGVAPYQGREITCAIAHTEEFVEENYSYDLREDNSDRINEEPESDHITETASQDLYPAQGQPYQLIPLMMVVHPPPFYYYTNPFANRCQMVGCPFQSPSNCSCQNDSIDDSSNKISYENEGNCINHPIEMPENLTAFKLPIQNDTEKLNDIPSNSAPNSGGPLDVPVLPEINSAPEKVENKIMKDNLEKEQPVKDTSRNSAVDKNETLPVHVVVPSLKVDKSTQTFVSMKDACCSTEHEVPSTNDALPSSGTKAKQKKNKRSVTTKNNVSDKNSDVCNNSTERSVLDTPSETINHDQPLEIQPQLDKISSDATNTVDNPTEQNSPKKNSSGCSNQNTVQPNPTNSPSLPRRNQSWKSQTHHDIITCTNNTKCPLGRLYLSDCEWVGSVEDRHSHFTKFHHAEFENNTSTKVLKNSYKVIKAFDEIFICYNSMHPTTNKLYCVVHHACVKLDCFSKFQYTCELSSEDNLQKIEDTRTVAPIYEPLKNLMRTGKCVRVDSKVLKSFFGKTFYIVFKIKPPREF
ncbi:hypothetical protein C0J52_25192 [Blattella germanica]|nr:hypothetical protein C0J52_25192 [Blattella germanica]